MTKLQDQLSSISSDGNQKSNNSSANNSQLENYEFKYDPNYNNEGENLPN